MSLLNKVITGRKRKPVCMLVYGTHGVGKSTFAAQMPSPIYIGPEENDELEAARLDRIQKWPEFEAQLKAIRDDGHDYKTLVIDTVDMLENVAEVEILKGKPDRISMATVDGGFGAGYKKMAKMFLDVREKYLSPIRDEKGMNIILLAHAGMEKIEDPISMTSYDNFYPQMDKRVRPIFENWVSAILFMNYVLYKTESSSGREYAIGEGARRIFTEERPSHQAKNRYGLPYEMDYTLKVGCSEIMKHIDDFYGESNSFQFDYLGKIRSIYPLLTEDEKAKVIEISTEMKEDVNLQKKVWEDLKHYAN